MKTITIPVPDWANWWTVDKDGSIAIWRDRPITGDDQWYLPDLVSEYKELTVTKPPTDWTKELHRIE